MVVYDLICAQGHNFEGWFNDLDDLDRQIHTRALVCPVCGDEDISRRPSTFGLVKSGRVEEKIVPAPAPALPVEELYRRWEEISGRLEKDYVDVGSNFADEALKMHYGAADRRNIRGQSTESQEELLRKEGVEFFKVPLLSRKNTPTTN